MRNRLHMALIACALVAWPTCQAQSTSAVEPRIIELTADEDSRYRHGGKIAPTIEVFAGEALILRITAVRAMEVARDGSVHGLALLDKHSDTVPRWRFFFATRSARPCSDCPLAGRSLHCCLHRFLSLVGDFVKRYWQ